MNEKYEVILMNKSTNPHPTYATDGSSGLDIRGFIESSYNLEGSRFVVHGDLSISIYPQGRVLIPTGLYIVLPKGKEAQIRSRSGMALKHGLIVLNTPGTIDSDYRGEIKILLHNASADIVSITPDSKIAQMVICNVETPINFETKMISEEQFLKYDTDRGDGGFGHTGV